MNDQELQVQEQLDEIIALLRDAAASIQAAAAVFAEMLNVFINDKLRETLQEIVDAMAAWNMTCNPKKKHPRPPRYAGPKNKGRLWTMAPQRVARSNCRRYRR